MVAGSPVIGDGRHPTTLPLLPVERPGDLVGRPTEALPAPGNPVGDIAPTP